MVVDPGTRTQLSLFVPGPARTLLDALRARADPLQHALIPAHATLVRDEDVTSWAVLRDRLAGLGPVRVELALGSPVLQHGGAYLPGVDSAGQFDALRRRLLFDQPGRGRTQSPHLTLMHPRHQGSFGMTPQALAAELAGTELPAQLCFEQVVMIVQDPGEPWRVVASSPAGPAAGG